MTTPAASTSEGGSEGAESTTPPKKSEVSELLSSMSELEKLSSKLNEKIEAFITSPTYVQTKKY